MDFDSPAAAQKAVAALKTTGVQAQMAKVRIHYSLILKSHQHKTPSKTVDRRDDLNRNHSGIKKQDRILYCSVFDSTAEVMMKACAGNIKWSTVSHCSSFILKVNLHF